MTKTQGNFKLRVIEGEFTDSQIVVMLGENGTGKTTFIRMLVSFLFLTFVFFVIFSCLVIMDNLLFNILGTFAGWFTET
jgi:ABC-type Na+ transport system ATPase subunit NatA